MRIFNSLLFVVLVAVLAGCPGTPCDFPVRCVDSCASRREVSFMCGPCPAGSVPFSSCTTDAGFDGGGLVDSPIASDVPFRDVSSTPDVPPPPDAPPPVDVGMTADAPLPPPNDLVSPDCGPADGPALRFGFFQRRGPGVCEGDARFASVDFYVHDLGGLTFPLTPMTIVSGGSALHGTATECPGGSPPCRTSESWTLVLETFVEDVGASGSYTIMWGDGTTRTGRFDAAWCTRPTFCG